MLKDALVSDAVEEIAKIGVPSDEEIDLLSSDYMKRINQIPLQEYKGQTDGAASQTGY